MNTRRHASNAVHTASPASTGTEVDWGIEVSPGSIGCCGRRSRGRRECRTTISPTPTCSRVVPWSVVNRASTVAGEMNFWPISTSTGIAPRTRRVRRLCAVEACAFNAVWRRSRSVLERLENAVETPPPERLCRRITAANIVNSATRIRSVAVRSATSGSSPAIRPSQTPRRIGPTGFGASSVTTESASMDGTPAPASRTTWSTISGKTRMNSASCRACSQPSADQTPPAPARPASGSVHPPVGILRNQIANQPAAAASRPAPRARGRARRNSRSG